MPDDRLSVLAARLRASPAELAGLAVLLAGVVAVAAVVAWTRGGGAAPATPATVAGSVLAPAAMEEGSEVPGEVTVHVAGAVATPGVLTLPAGSRVTDAVRAAGGVTRDADPDALNLARELVDGERIVVPVVDAPPGEDAPAEATGSGGVAGDGRIDINRASPAELEALPGVGPVLAGRIVAHREEHGPFAEVGQLRDVPGIGERTFQSLAELVTVG